jgi:hypothetical protein
MHIISERNPKNLDELAVLMPHAPWRLEQFGDEILKVLATKYTKAEHTVKRPIRTKAPTFTKAKR